MHALIGALQPASALVGEVRVAQEGPPVEEIPAEIADRPLHLALGLGPVGTAGSDAEAPVGGEPEELRILKEPAAGRPMIVDDHALHLVEEDLVGHAAEGREGPLEAHHHGERSLARHEVDEEHPRVAEHHQQREARAPGQADRGEIELRLVAGRGLEANDRLRHRPRADARYVRFELAIAAGVARRTTLLEQPDGRQLRVGRQPLLNQRLVALQLRGTRGGAAGVRCAAQLTIELARPDPVIDRPATDAQLPRDGGLREPRLQVVFEQHEGIPSVHRPAPPTRSRQAPNDEAPTSGPTPDTRSVQFFPAILCNLKSAMTRSRRAFALLRPRTTVRPLGRWPGGSRRPAPTRRHHARFTLNTLTLLRALQLVLR